MTFIYLNCRWYQAFIWSRPLYRLYFMIMPRFHTSLIYVCNYVCRPLVFNPEQCIYLRMERKATTNGREGNFLSFLLEKKSMLYYIHPSVSWFVFNPLFLLLSTAAQWRITVVHCAEECSDVIPVVWLCCCFFLPHTWPCYWSNSVFSLSLL